MRHVLAVLGLAAACAVWLLVQRLSGRPVDGCCGARTPADEDEACADCPEAGGRRAAGGRAGSVAGLLLVLLAGALEAGCAPGDAAGRHSAERTLMGTRFAIELVGDDEAAARAAIEAAFAEVARVEELLSEWKASSEISAVNRAAGGAAVPVGPELIEVLQRAAEISELTDGAFDVSFAACGGLWSFREERVPSEAELAACTQLVDWRGVLVDEERSTVRLRREGMRIGIAGIGKGWGVDRAAAVLEERGFAEYLVDGGGDVRLSGRPWRVGVRHPRRPDRLLGRLEVSDGAIVTSGDYFRWFERDGVRYHHLLDPRTGRPARGCASVTVIAPDATTADALATGLFALGPEAGLAVVERLPGVEALFVAEDGGLRPSAGFPELAPAR